MLGINILREQAENDDIGGSQERIHSALFLQDKINIKGKDKFFLVPGVRFTYNDSYGLNVTPKLSIRYNISKLLFASASYGGGYKVPTFKQMYYSFFHTAPENFWLHGNPDLRPEKSQSVDFSTTFKPIGCVEVSGRAHYSKLHNLITSVIIDTNSGVYEGNEYIYQRRYENKDEAYITGVDFSLKLIDWYNLTFSASYAYTIAREYSEDAAAYVDIEGKSPQSVRFLLRYSLMRWKTIFNFNLTWNDRQLIDRDEDEYCESYLMLNIGIRQPIYKYFEIYGGIKNLLNNQESYYGLYDGRTYYIGAKASFSDIADLFHKK